VLELRVTTLRFYSRGVHRESYVARSITRHPRKEEPAERFAQLNRDSRAERSRPDPPTALCQDWPYSSLSDRRRPPARGRKPALLSQARLDSRREKLVPQSVGMGIDERVDHDL
jgi:hypothetical protein